MAYTFTKHLAHWPMKKAVEKALRVPEERRSGHQKRTIDRANAWREALDKWAAAVTARALR